jgi:hypothetical protein
MENEMIRIGVICPAEIAYRRFMPALEKNRDFAFVGIAVPGANEFIGYDDLEKSCRKRILEREIERAQAFTKAYGGIIHPSYEAMVTSPDIDAVYIPLPPALHYRWAKAALENGKHVLVEKPATLQSSDTRELITIAAKNSLALHENYMFVFHNQIGHINTIVNSGELGDIRLYRITFGFPMREANDFRYNKELGGGALYDAGGYTVKYASMLLNGSARLVYASMSFVDGFPVDMYGSAAMMDDQGATVQIAYGMDNSYRCDLEIWGSAGMLTTGRVLTVPDGFVPEAVIRKGNNEERITLPADDAFAKSIDHFRQCIGEPGKREGNCKEILWQASLVDEFIAKSSGGQGTV